MKDIIPKLKTIIKSLEEENGPLLFCGLFLREGVPERWDLIFSASWLFTDKMESYEIISSKLQESLTDAEFVPLSRIVILNKDDPVVSYLLDQEIVVNGGYKLLSAEELSDKFKFTIKKAYILRAQKLK